MGEEADAAAKGGVDLQGLSAFGSVEQCSVPGEEGGQAHSPRGSVEHGGVSAKSEEEVPAHWRSAPLICAFEGLWESFENHPQFHVLWHCTECGDDHAWKVLRFSFVGALSPAPVATAKVAAHELSSLEAARINAARKRGEKKNVSEQLGFIPIGTQLTTGTEPFDTSSTTGAKRGLGRGVVWYLATHGGLKPFMCPMLGNQLRVTSSGWMGALSVLVGNCARVSSSRGIEGSWFCIELAVYLVPSHYSLRHGFTSADGALYNWDLLGSADGQVWRVLRSHRKDASLATGAFSAFTWSIHGDHAHIPCRFFKVKLTGTHVGVGNMKIALAVPPHLALLDQSVRATLPFNQPQVFRKCSGLGKMSHPGFKATDASADADPQRLRRSTGVAQSENPLAMRRQRIAPDHGGRHFLYCSGFELYGEIVSPPPGHPAADTSAWRWF